MPLSSSANVTPQIADSTIVSHDDSRVVPLHQRAHSSLRVNRFNFAHIRDCVIVTLTSPVWLPIFAVCCILVKVTDRGAPVFYIQKRTGKDGSIFDMYKFRTMVANADSLKEGLRDQSTVSWPDFKLKNDPRITAVGRILRKSSLDEIPQVLNVLKGEMTFIGPRPTSFHSSTYEPWQTKRLEVTPGLTGSWQVDGRGKTEFDERSRIDIRYMRSKSTRGDLRILLRTFTAIFRGQ